MIDAHVYYVTTVNGYRSPWLTLAQAKTHAERLKQQMVLAGWAGKVRLHYRDGSEIKSDHV